ncbi:A/G-specific adenine glycosylase [Cryobacterium psychrophilum]|uniref:Adenine DNA glycosylase n=1 Tax=Cryobacterium psychrophilum TaxID=41988 RepID=A0A4Y8KUS4_9MICO|nr:A/G-specific adenine glycosylase [Cryobacterium psychrophilum]TDW29113.1 A/G-specific DNA-adenine glycosylase [Cryobacterium psychrophilum]TFD79678.1 A/G-specific adenine glycosylase [Cryobacterium psychrophilum]
MNVTAPTTETGAPTGALSPVLNEWFRGNARDLPWRRSDFSPWGVLVSEFMLQQTPVVRVIPRLNEWLARWPTPAHLAAAPPSEAVRAWASLGYPRRALWLHAAAVQITERHDGRVPEEVDDLLSLTGVGDYTARAVAVFAFGHRHPVVDTNTRRVLARSVTGQAEPAPPSRTRDLDLMSSELPEDPVEAAVFNAATMELGAVVCTSRSPHCAECPLRDSCAWRALGYPAYTGARKAVQKKFEGSDRQVRGLIMAELRSTHRPVTAEEITGLWADAAQRDRALASLLVDGLAVPAPAGGYTLPG